MFACIGKEAGDDVIVIGRVVSAELRLYWPSCVCIGRVALYRPSFHSNDSDRFCHINTVLLIVFIGVGRFRILGGQGL